MIDASEPSGFAVAMARTLRKYNMIDKGSRVLVAFSGGADSLALLRAFMEIKTDWDLSVAAAHLDHGLRGADSLADADWAEDFCASEGIAFFRGFWPGYSEVKEGQSPEAPARAARRRFLEETLRAWEGDVIALGHHLDDQAETALIHLAKGAGLRGMGGMKPVNGAYIRPLLETRKGEIMDYISGLGVTPRFDATNDDQAYARNMLRRQVTPVLKEINPGFDEAVGRMTALIREEDAYLDKLAAQALTAMIRDARGDTKLAALYALAGFPEANPIPAEKLLALDPVLARRALRAWASEAGLTLDMAATERLYGFIAPAREGESVQAGGGFSLIKTGKYLIIERERRIIADFNVLLRTDDLKSGFALVLPGGMARAQARLIGKRELHASEGAFELTAYEREGAFALDAVEYTGELKRGNAFEGVEPMRLIDRFVYKWPESEREPERKPGSEPGSEREPEPELVFRHRRPGDWLRMPYGSKSLKKLLIEKGAPRHLRSSLPLLARGSQVLWIPGIAKSVTANQSPPEISACDSRGGHYLLFECFINL